MSCKYIVFIIAATVVATAYAKPQSLPMFVSLGGSCEPALELKAFGLRTEAYPFDWMITRNFEDVCRLIETKFKDFLTPKYLEHTDKYVFNTHCNLCFYHDFPRTPAGAIVENFIDSLGDIRQKYERRIARFLKLLDGSTQVVFIRTKITPAQAQRFVAMMQKNYPLANYELLVIHSKQDLDYNWNIARVKSFCIQEKRPVQLATGWRWTSSEKWKNIFRELGFITPTKKTWHTMCEYSWLDNQVDD